MALSYSNQKQPLRHKGAAMQVLDSIQGLRLNTKKSGKSISGIGRVTLAEDQNELSISDYNPSIAKNIQRSKRKQITMQLSRSKQLSTKLVKELGLGVLFNRSIW